MTFHSFDLDLMILKLDLNVFMYLHTRNEFSSLAFQKLLPGQADRQTKLNEVTTYPHAQMVIIKSNFNMSDVRYEC